MASPLDGGSTPLGYRASGTVEALRTCGVRWQEADPERLTDVRWWLVKGLKAVFRHLKRPEVCTSETYQELVRTPRMQQRLLALGLLKEPVSEPERRRDELAKLMRRHDRMALYEQVWAQPVREVVKSRGISGTALAKTCRKLQVPFPSRGYWARVQNGTVRKPHPCPS